MRSLICRLVSAAIIAFLIVMISLEARMTRTTTINKPLSRKKSGASKPRAEIAAALFAGALTLFALADMPARAPTPAAIPAAVAPAEQAPAPLHSASYYPEHLAALQSLRGFQPMANEGEKPVVSSVVALVKPIDLKAPRRGETRTVAAPPAGARGQAAQPSPPAPATEPFKLFGLSLPDVGAQVNAQVNTMRAAASTLWR